MVVYSAKMSHLQVSPPSPLFSLALTQVTSIEAHLHIISNILVCLLLPICSNCAFKKLMLCSAQVCSCDASGFTHATDYNYLACVMD